VLGRIYPVQVRSELKTLRVPPAGDFLWQYVYSTPVADAASKLDEDRRADLHQEVVTGWEPFAHDGSLVLEVDMTSAIGRRA
jgi:hypothetical protein